MKKLLVICHEGSDSGATTSLYLSLKHFKGFRNYQFYFYFLQEGSTVTRFQEIGQVLGEKDLTLFTYDLILANTVSTLSVGKELKDKQIGKKIVAYVHELGVIIDQLAPNLLFQTEEIDGWVCASELVKNYLLKNFAISSPIETIYESFESPPYNTSPTNQIIIGGSGFVHWRKGTDWFLQIASKIAKKRTDIEFEWLGGIQKHEIPVYEKELELLGIKKKVKFPGHKTNVGIFLSKWSLFLLTSREDPFPLAALEALSCEVPVLCWKGTSGMEEILPTDWIIPYGDLDLMVEACLKVINLNKQERSKLIPEVIDRFSSTKTGEKLFNFVDKVIDN